MPVEGRGLSSRPTQDVVRDLEIGQPSNSETCSETTDGVTRESEGGGRLSLLRPVRQSMDASRRQVILLASATIVRLKPRRATSAFSQVDRRASCRASCRGNRLTTARAP